MLFNDSPSYFCLVWFTLIANLRFAAAKILKKIGYRNK